MEPPRWYVITPSQYEGERRGLDFIRTGLPDHDPYRAWANFEFQTDDGAIYEVDLLVLTKLGFWLVEAKAWAGRIWGDSATWTCSHEGRTRSEDNPVLLANRKAKSLASLLKSQSAVSKVRLSWLDALVFLSTDNLQFDLTGPARNRVLLKDRPADAHHPERKGILAALINRDGPGIDPEPRTTIDIKVARALDRAREQAGIRPSQRSRRVGDYVLGELIADGPGYQDRLAKHASFENVFCRVHQYTVAHASSEDDRQRLKRAAAREFQIIQRLDHTGILPVLDYKEHEHGPALLFRYLDPGAVRFDHYLTTHGSKLSTGQRLDMLRQVADAIRLILFDFSLARAPLENIHVGTEGYRDPFLKNRKPERWDLAAERYAAAVTLYEMTLGAGVLPEWSKPNLELTDAELVIEAEKFDPSVREGMEAFGVPHQGNPHDARGRQPDPAGDHPLRQ